MTPRIWQWFDGTIKVHCSKEQRNHLMQLEGASQDGYQIRPDGPKMYYVILPTKHRSQAEKVLKSECCGTTT